MKIKELREKTAVELDRLLTATRNKLRELRFRVASKQLSDVREIRQVRLTIARILTLKKAAPPASAPARGGSAFGGKAVKAAEEPAK